MGKKQPKVEETPSETIYLSHDGLIDPEKLLNDVRNDSQSILQLIDTIRPECFFSSDVLAEYKEDYHKKADEKFSKLKIKRNGKELSKKTKHKRAKLDPTLKWSVSNILEQQAVRDKDNGIAIVNKPSLTRAELKEKLQAKLKAIREARGAAVESMTGDIEKKREKRRLSKKKMRDRLKSEKNEKIKGPKFEKPLSKSEKKENVKKLPDASSIVFNKDKTLVFNRFDFDESGKQDKKPKGKLSGKNYKQLIQKVEKDQEELKQLEETDKDKAEIVKEKQKWQTVLARAEGIKVKDDLLMLKKALKRKTKTKERSERKWQERESAVKAKQNKRQEKRKTNIKKRKDEKIQKKIKRSIKKGRMIEGVSNI
ncbi:surfeit locus protein [Chamberlinius hualienensis]